MKLGEEEEQLRTVLSFLEPEFHTWIWRAIQLNRVHRPFGKEEGVGGGCCPSDVVQFIFGNCTLDHLLRILIFAPYFMECDQRFLEEERAR